MMIMIQSFLMLKNSPVPDVVAQMRRPIRSQCFLGSPFGFRYSCLIRALAT